MDNVIMANSYEHIAGHDIEIKHDRKDGSMDYYDVVLSKDGNEIKNMKGCIGLKSAEYWKTYIVKIISRLEILKTRKEMVLHNLLCYSSNYLMSEPKEGYEKEYKETKTESEVIEIWIKEIESDFIGGVYKK